MLVLAPQLATALQLCKHEVQTVAAVQQQHWCCSGLQAIAHRAVANFQQQAAMHTPHMILVAFAPHKHSL